MRAVLQGLFLALITLGAPFRAYSINEELAESINHTGMFLYYITDKSQNTVISPLAISTSLLMTYMGAKGNTAHQIAMGLHLTIPQKEVPFAYLSLVNQLAGGRAKIQIDATMWIDEKSNVLGSYKSLISKKFDGSIHSVNFLKPLIAAKSMNKWIYEKSDGKIARFIDPSILSSSTQLILINSLFLKGSWGNPFPTQNTEQQPFLKKDGSSVSCRMMHQSSELYYFENDDSQIVALPIDNLNSHLAFVIFLPKKNLSDLYNFYYSQDEKKPEGFISYLQHLKKAYVNISIPKFIVSQKLNLIPLYRSLGINEALSTRADFSGIDGTKNLMISEAFQQNVLSIDEGGIFATAATASSLSLNSSKSGNAAQFVANHPFLYAVYDFDTKLLLFLGECQDPSQTGITKVTGGKSP